jgi:hypothetical protein
MMNLNANSTSFWPPIMLVLENMNMVPNYQCLMQFEVTIPPRIYNES